jgi:uncharacterized protein
MPALYVDTSALGRLMFGERDASAIIDCLRKFDQHIASRLLRIELRRLGLRFDRLADADRLLNGIALLPLDESVLAAAETVAPPTVATLDAIHLVAAVRLAEAGLLDAVLTYDERFAAGAREHGLRVLAPH